MKKAQSVKITSNDDYKIYKKKFIKDAMIVIEESDIDDLYINADLVYYIYYNPEKENGSSIIEKIKSKRANYEYNLAIFFSGNFYIDFVNQLIESVKSQSNNIFWGYNESLKNEIHFLLFINK